MFDSIIGWVKAPSKLAASNAKPFIPKFRYARVVSVYDGDTITIAAKRHFLEKAHTFKVRIAGIDCPELRTKDEEEKKFALIAKQCVEEMILNKIIGLDIKGYDKYGRLLADVVCDKVNIAHMLLDTGLAITYNGKTKPQVNWYEFVKLKNPNLLIINTGECQSD